MSDSLGKKSSRQATEPTLSGSSAEVWALWRLSLVLREIAENLASPAKKEEPPYQAPARSAPTPRAISPKRLSHHSLVAELPQAHRSGVVDKVKELKNDILKLYAQ